MEGGQGGKESCREGGKRRGELVSEGARMEGRESRREEGNEGSE